MLVAAEAASEVSAFAARMSAADAPVDAFLVLALIVVPEPEDESGPVVVEMVPQAVTSAIAARAASAPPVRCARRPRGSAGEEVLQWVQHACLLVPVIRRPALGRPGIGRDGL